MKTYTSMQSPFLFNPATAPSATWPTPQQPRSRRAVRSLSLAAETQIDYKQEVICGVILMLCLLFGMAAFMVQFALA